MQKLPTFYYPRCDFKAVQCSVLENALLLHPLVVDCAAFALNCDGNIEVPAACVVIRGEASGVEVCFSDRIYLNLNCDF